MNKIIKYSIRLLGYEFCRKSIKYLSSITRNIAFRLHHLQYKIEWEVASNPEWFDHYIDQFYLFRQSQNPLWVERGVFNLLAMRENSETLELCCGDGYNSYHFYSIRANSVIAVDFDPKAIEHAQKYNQADNIKYTLCDIRIDMPEGIFDNILWDAAIGHFTSEETKKIMHDIKIRLKKDGILSGYTIVKRDDGIKSLQQHEYEFSSKEELRDFLTPYFSNVSVFETNYPSRRNLYFYASDGVIPFDDNWPTRIHTKVDKLNQYEHC